MKPRSDFECSRCVKTFADLPITTAKCPDCARGKFFTRVYAANISTTGIAKKKEPQLEAAYETARAPKEAAKLSQRALSAPQLAVPMGQLGAHLQHHAKAQLQQAGVPESRMQAMLPAPVLKPGKSSYRDGTLRKEMPMDRSLTNEIKLHPPKPKIAGRDAKAGEAITKGLGR